MATVAVLVLAGLAFSLFASVIEIRGAREARRRLLRRSAVLHPLAQHPLPRVRTRTSQRVLRHIGLFIAFLLATYFGLLVLKVVWAFLARWF